MSFAFTIDPNVRPHLTLGVLEAHGASIGTDHAELWAAIDATCAELRAKHEGRAPSEIEGLQFARRLYKSFGVDPTKTRPSSEALLRRVRKGQALYRVNTLVDLWNWQSLRYLMSIGLYDRAKILGRDLTVRLGTEGEVIGGIRKKDVNLEGRLCIADSKGAFGSPTSDSPRTSITEATREVLVVVFATPDFPRVKLDAMLADGAAAMAHYTGATTTRQDVV